MEKVIVLLRAEQSDEQWCDRLRTRVCDHLLALGLPGLTLNVRDDAVRDSLMTLTTLDPPVMAVVSMWVRQYYAEPVESALKLLAAECDSIAAYLVTESVPMTPAPTAPGERTDGLANIALLRRPAELDEATWLHRWHRDHTSVAIETQDTFGYTQNTVVRALTADAPAIDGIVEELFPLAAVSDLHAFFGAADDDLADRMRRMVASTDAFGASTNIDTVPTSRYVYRSPFADPAPESETCSS
ncbi:hypothetical protein A5733_06135 [Mycobacterium sp. NS-7484]|uniref:EthD domain-containing protein n=1 Tax=Mycobacterium sp. NS-7484 TaxID=1834161 RepID=UPI00096C46FF|nr:EthD domain-containing protein [Mycobacterium sp. NS-7484]OMB99443.1 hypothetical protein A5733_06135 [Mycobacterium sp. NS-7484]